MRPVDAAKEKLRLLRLSESDLDLQSDDEDLRNWGVIDSDGRDIGKVCDLLLDRGQMHIRFVEVTAWELPEEKMQKILVPIDAVTNITNDCITINQPWESLMNAPRYEPSRLNETILRRICKFFGSKLFWSPGETHPTFFRCYV